MKKSNTPIIKHINDFLEYCEIEKGLSPVSTHNYHNFLKKFISWTKDVGLEGIKPHEFDADLLWKYRVYLSRKKDYRGNFIKKTTQSYYLRALRGLFNYFATRDITALPSDKITLPKLTDKDKEIKFLKFEQVKKLLAIPDLTTKSGLRDRAILELLFSTGMRVSELTSLNLNQLNVSSLLKDKFTDQELNIYGKGGSARTVFFSKRALEWLSKYLKTRDDMLTPLFINYHRSAELDNDHRLSVRSVERFVKKYTVMAGLPVDATPHTLRHSYATDLLEQGADLRSVQELLGHKNVATTQIYTHVTNKGLKDIHTKFHSGRK